jgi:hypothetical protein
MRGAGSVFALINGLDAVKAGLGANCNLCSLMYRCFAGFVFQNGVDDAHPWHQFGPLSRLPGCLPLSSILGSVPKNRLTSAQLPFMKQVERNANVVSRSLSDYAEEICA